MKISLEAVIVILILAVVGVFLFTPYLNPGDGSQFFAGMDNVDVPEDGKVKFPTNITCEKTQDCIDFVKDKDPKANVTAECETNNTCTYFLRGLKK